VEPNLSTAKDDTESDNLYGGIGTMVINLNKILLRLRDANKAIRRRISTLQIAASEGWTLAEAFVDVTDPTSEARQLVQARELLEVRRKKFPSKIQFVCTIASSLI